MKEFALQPILSLSKCKYAEVLFEHHHDIKSYFNIHKRWERKTDLAGLKITLSIYTFNLQLTFIADKRIWDKSADKWEEGSEAYFKA
ncbi:hypothetical protein LCGC14_1317930 [marine sediment metagenome]|uniref:Uncharacterized protein n=1 Tax=marine sediment metagenome TaxID=412755 RepID=A0A0F9NMN3_9ZZZZ